MAADDEQPVDWAGRTYGQLSNDEKRRVRREAAAALQAELARDADKIVASLQSPVDNE